MKIRILPAILWLMLCAVWLPGQQNNLTLSDRQPGYYIFGINGGWAYQQSDVPATSKGYGLGLTLGKNLFYQPGGLSFDLRGRLLYAQSYGLDTQRSSGLQNNTALNGTNGPDYSLSPGFVYGNHKTSIGELGLEGVINFEGLRQKKNLHLALFGGIGLDYYKTKIDQLNGTELYDYGNIDPNSNTMAMRSALQNLWDGNYETAADGFADGSGEIKFMPSLGAELGYWFSPRFALSLGHRATWARTDVLDGQQWDNNNGPTGNNDLYHYTSLGLKWIIEGDRVRGARSPIINVLQPYSSPFTTSDPRSIVRANIKNINSAMDVDYRINGRSVRFDYINQQLSQLAELTPGRNEIVISASNSGGKAIETIVVIYDPQEVVPPPAPDPVVRYPEVLITNPGADNVTTQLDRFTVEAQVREVPNRNDLRVYVNGVDQSGFSYRENTGQLTAAISLQPGRNDIRIVAETRSGRASDEVALFYENRIARPQVRITVPSADPFRTEQSRLSVRAVVEHVDYSNDIELSLNGRRSYDFDYNPGSAAFFTEVNLREGNNTLIIRARNAGGEAEDQIQIQYRPYVAPPPPPPPVVRAPEVRIISMSPPRSTTDYCQVSLTASVRNVDNKNAIEMLINGRRYYDFDFNPRNQQLRAALNLTKGRTQVVVRANNRGGSDQDRAFADCELAAPILPAPVVAIQSPADNSTTGKSTMDFVGSVRHIANANAIQLQLNGRRISNFNFDPRSGRLTGTLNLIQGDNTIVLSAQNESGRDQARVGVKYLGMVASPRQQPTVEIVDPRNDRQQAQNILTFRALTRHVGRKSDIRLSLNGQNTNQFEFSPITKTITANLSLREGKNTIVVNVFNTNGAAQDSRIVTFRPPAPALPAPTVTFSSPANNSTITQNRTIIKATVNHVTVKDLSLTVNGQAQQNFRLDGKQFTANVLLTAGENTVVLLASHQGGRDSDQLIIRYQLPVKDKPIVTFLQPTDNKKIYTRPKLNLEVKVENVAGQKDIRLLLNGKEQSEFAYDARTQRLSASINLSRGSNTLRVEAQNEAGKASAQADASYRPRIAAPTPNAARPVIQIVSVGEPTVNPFSGEGVKSTVIATISGVSNKAQISMVVNQERFEDFSYDAAKGEFRAIIPVRRGKNSFTITASNRAGKSEASRDLDY